jgi:hypothetical protein
MSERTAELVWLAVAGYLGIGVLLAAITLLFRLKRLDAGASDMPVRVRALVFPGLALLWPLVLARLAGASPVEDRP